VRVALPGHADGLTDAGGRRRGAVHQAAELDGCLVLIESKAAPYGRSIEPRGVAAKPRIVQRDVIDKFAKLKFA
jgi:hypothetical protein